MSLPDAVESLAGRALGALRAPLVASGRARVHSAIILTYHDVGEDESSEVLYYLSPDRLRAQLSLVSRSGARFVTLAELVDAFLAGDPLDGLAAVTFDDGLVGVHHHALPVLLDLGVPATVFVVSDLPDTAHPPWYPGSARTMTRAELKELSDAGIQLESHTRTHADLPTLDETKLRDELTGSRAVIEDLTAKPVQFLAYPFGHHDDRVRAAAADCGYRAAFTFLNGRVTPGLDPYRLPRLNMWSGQGGLRLAYHLARPTWSWGDHQVERVSGPGPQPVS